MISKNIVIIENTFYTVLSLRMEIIKHLQNHGYTLHILSSGLKEDSIKLENLNCYVYDLGVLVNNPFSAFRFLYKMAYFLRKIKPVIAFSFTIRPNIFGSIICRLLSIPIVANVTGIGPLFESNSILYFLVKGLYKLAFLKTKTVFFQNNDDFKLFLEHNYVLNSQAIVLPGSGVDTDYYIPRNSVNKSTAFTFLMISRLIYDKGVLEYVKASEIVKKEFPDIECQLLGPFWTQNVKKNTITKDEISFWESKKLIKYLGHTYDVRPFIADADCIVLPSYREGCANVLMQGGSMAKPLIASNVTGCNNLIVNEETGYLCAPKNERDLALKMKKMIALKEEERIKMGERGREFMKINYQKKIVLDAYLKEVEEINIINRYT